MKAIFNLLEEEGFVQDADSLKVHSYTPKQIERLYRILYEAVWKSQNEESIEEIESDPFSYVASASIRGDSSCWEIPCRIAKLDFLNSFAALYANKVSVPLLISRPDKTSGFTEYDTTVLSLSLLTLLRARPLIEAGILFPTVMQTRHCEHHHEQVNNLVEAAQGYAFELAKKYEGEFEAIYQTPEKSPSGKSTIYLSGPSDFLEHDMVQLFDESPTWRMKSWRFDKEGRVKLRGRRKLRSIERIFEGIAENTTFYLAYGLSHKSRFLSDLPGEVLMLRDSGEESRSESVSTTTAAFRHLNHCLPLLAGFAPGEILRIRNEDRDSFAAYQFEVATITKEALQNGLDEAAAQEIFRSNLLPKITKLKKELGTEQEKTSKYLGFGAVSLAASVAIGGYGLPLLSAIQLATVGTGLLAKGVQRAIEVNPEARQKNDLYFLVRLLQENS